MTTRHYVHPTHPTYRLEVTDKKISVIYGNPKLLGGDYAVPFDNPQWLQVGIEAGTIVRVPCKVRAKKIIGR